MRLDDLPPGTPVFIDADIFIYHFTGASEECTRFVRRCEAGELAGVTSVSVLRRLMPEGLLAVSQQVRREHGLLVDDSLLLAVMREGAVRTLATRDADLGRIEEMTVALPADV